MGSIILIWLLWRYWEKIKPNLGKITGDFQPGGITDTRKEELRALAEVAHDAIYGINWSTVAQSFIGIWAHIPDTSASKTDILRQVDTVNDNELEFISKYYKDKYDANLCEDIDDELMPYTNVDETLISRLERMKQC